MLYPLLREEIVLWGAVSAMSLVTTTLGRYACKIADEAQVNKLEDISAVGGSEMFALIMELLAAVARASMVTERISSGQRDRAVMRVHSVRRSRRPYPHVTIVSIEDRRAASCLL